jgi:hypothetical protein
VGEPWTAAHGTLFESRLSTRGARYERLSEFPLAAVDLLGRNAHT